MHFWPGQAEALMAGTNWTFWAGLTGPRWAGANWYTFGAEPTGPLFDGP